MRPAIVLILLALLPLGGCQTFLEPPRPVRPLAPPIDQYHHVEQLLTLSWKKQSRRLHCVLVTRPGDTRVVAITETGMPVFELQQTASNVDIDRSPLLPPQVSPDVILADIQLIYWPRDALLKALPPPLRLVDKPGFRKLYDGDKLEARVNYDGDDHWNSPATLVNDHYGYRLRVQPLGKDDTDATTP